MGYADSLHDMPEVTLNIYFLLESKLISSDYELFQAYFKNEGFIDLITTTKTDTLLYLFEKKIIKNTKDFREIVESEYRENIDDSHSSILDNLSNLEFANDKKSFFELISNKNFANASDNLDYETIKYISERNLFENSEEFFDFLLSFGIDEGSNVRCEPTMIADTIKFKLVSEKNSIDSPIKQKVIDLINKGEQTIAVCGYGAQGKSSILAQVSRHFSDKHCKFIHNNKMLRAFGGATEIGRNRSITEIDISDPNHSSEFSDLEILYIEELGSLQDADIHNILKMQKKNNFKIISDMHPVFLDSKKNIGDLFEKVFIEPSYTYTEEYIDYRLEPNSFTFNTEAKKYIHEYFNGVIVHISTLIYYIESHDSKHMKGKYNNELSKEDIQYIITELINTIKTMDGNMRGMDDFLSIFNTGTRREFIFTIEKNGGSMPIDKIENTELIKYFSDLNIIKVENGIIKFTGGYFYNLISMKKIGHKYKKAVLNENSSSDYDAIKIIEEEEEMDYGL